MIPRCRYPGVRLGEAQTPNTAILELIAQRFENLKDDITFIDSFVEVSVSKSGFYGMGTKHIDNVFNAEIFEAVNLGGSFHLNAPEGDLPPLFQLLDEEKRPVFGWLTVEQ